MAYDRYGRDRDYDRGHRRERAYDRYDDRGRSRSPYGYGREYDRDDDRGFFDRASDEVRSWFGDDEAERRRMMDERRQREEERASGYGGGYYGGGNEGGYGRTARYGAPSYGGAAFGAYGPLDSYELATPYGSPRGGLGSYGEAPRYRSIRDEGRRWRGGESQDSAYDYRAWRDRQMETFDRDYHDYRQERQSAFDDDFGKWHDNRQNQRKSLRQVREHMDVVGSDGEHVGTVDHVRGDHIKLTKTDSAAGGHHHSIPCSWVSTVDTKVTLNKAAVDAKRGWQDEDRDGERGEGAHVLNRSFSGTY